MPATREGAPDEPGYICRNCNQWFAGERKPPFLCDPCRQGEGPAPPANADDLSGLVMARLPVPK